MDELPLPPADPPLKIVRMAILFEGGLAVLAVVCGWFMRTPPWQRVEWRWDDAGWGLSATAPLVLGLLLMRRARGGPFGRLNAVVDDFLVPLFAQVSWPQLALVSLLAGVGEELFFRGVLQPVLIGWVGAAAGLIAASVVFGLLHAITPTYAVLATAVGAYLGWLALASGNLLGPIIAHGVYDFFALVLLTRTSKPASSALAVENP